MQARHADLLAACAFLAGAALMGWESTADAYQSVSAGVAQNAVFYPRIVLVITTVLALLLAGRALLGRPAAAESRGAEETLRWRPVWALMIATSAYAALMPSLGFMSATLVFIAITPVLLGFRRWLVLALVAALFPLGAWFLFHSVIGIPLPTLELFGLG